MARDPITGKSIKDTFDKVPEEYLTMYGGIDPDHPRFQGLDCFAPNSYSAVHLGITDGRQALARIEDDPTFPWVRVPAKNGSTFALLSCCSSLGAALDRRREEARAASLANLLQTAVNSYNL